MNTTLAISGLWRTAAVGMAAIIVSGIGSFILMSSKPTATEVKEMISTHAPYVLDKQYIESTLNRHTADLNKIHPALQEIKVQQAGIESKIDLVLKNLNK